MAAHEDLGRCVAHWLDAEAVAAKVPDQALTLVDAAPSRLQTVHTAVLTLTTELLVIELLPYKRVIHI